MPILLQASLRPRQHEKLSYPHVVNVAAQPQIELHVLPGGDCIFFSGRHGGGGVRIAVSGRLVAAIHVYHFTFRQIGCVC